MSEVYENSALAPVSSGSISCQGCQDLTLGALEALLLARYPSKDAEAWDQTGLIVGDPAAKVQGVAVALDATVDAVLKAKAVGANVLLTHHPVFIEAPARFQPLSRECFGAGSVVYAAIESGVALMNFHTALDVSADAARMLPGLLGLNLQSIVCPVVEEGRGYGQLCAPRAQDAPFTLRSMAARCLSVFGRPARVWGSLDRSLESIVTCTGSAGDLVQLCVQAGYDCLICGELRYHSALSACEAGLCIIELGHDVSELPFCAVLAAAVASLGYPESSITILDQSNNWTTPEAIRK